MDAVPNHSLLIVTGQDMKKARQLCNLQSGIITESLNAIQEWCKKQDHLVEASQYLNLHIHEVLFLMSRGSIERTKMRIDKLFTSRGLMPELTLNRSLDEFERLLDCVNYVPLPKLCPTDQSRVMVTQFLTDNVDEFNLLTYFRYCFMIGEYRMHYDYSFSERYIIDLTNVHLGYLGKINPVVVKKAEVLCSEGYGTKIKGIHILNAPSFVDRLVFILKQALRDKVAKRLHVHSSFEDLYKHVPKEILPKEYGGLEQSCDQLAARDYLERTIITCKGSVERAKARLEINCTLKTLFPKFFEKSNYRDDLRNVHTGGQIVVCPKLTKDYCRVIIPKPLRHFPEGYLNYFRSNIILSEYLMSHDYCAGFIIIFDYIDLPNILDLVKTLNVIEMRQAVQILMEGYGMRLKGLYILSQSKMIEALVMLVKQVISEKLHQRVHVVKTREAMTDYISKEILPEEYGGDECSMVKLHKNCVDVLSSEEHIEYFKKMSRAATNESLRSRDQLASEYMGLSGTFRTLNVD